ncbi:MAG: hypothetical protein Q8O03_06720 [Nanoarchaeota archaeon]|nr:hypothetical protein [Nanoarchaeota archaeon]
MNKLVLALTALLALPSVLADYGMMDGFRNMMGSGYGMMGAGSWMMGGFFGLIYFAILSFVFSVVFWWTYKWLVKEKKTKK